ncbi:uncharacterized protein [Branchiostoma lanceolatum]|uniref:uncharacterized protein n=1 Tax=Branchiostoma lanceolatum TaxID=7740 RepID=UPI0034551521
MAAVLVVSIGVAAFFLIKRRRALKDAGTSSHHYDMVDPGTADDGYEMIDTQDSRPPARSTQQDSRPQARSLQAPATVPPPPGVSVTQSDSDYQALDPRTMCNTDSEYTSLTTNQTSADDSDYENDPEYQNTFGKIYENA